MNIKRIIREEIEDFDWIKDQTPIQLEDPQAWVGRSFGYGQPIINQMTDREIYQGDDEEYFTIISIDNHGKIPLIKYHPLLGEISGEASTSVNILRNYISKGDWIWVG